MTIFDLLPTSDLDDLPEEEMVEEVGKRLGKKFEMITLEGYRSKWHAYKCKICGIVLTIDGFSSYNTGDERHGKRMILVSWDNKKEQAGGGAPCDSIEEVVSYFENIIRRESERTRKKQSAIASAV